MRTLEAYSWDISSKDKNYFLILKIFVMFFDFRIFSFGLIPILMCYEK